jgi:hypothetical protein
MPGAAETHVCGPADWHRDDAQLLPVGPEKPSLLLCRSDTNALPIQRHAVTAGLTVQCPLAEFPVVVNAKAIGLAVANISDEQQTFVAIANDSVGLFEVRSGNR